MTFGIMQHLDIVLCKDADDAQAQGFVYREPEYKPISIEKVVVVQDGTLGGMPTVDLVLVDASGQKFVTMMTGRLLAGIPLPGVNRGKLD
jgi:hypothetical protein